jgi:DNA-binding NarL/FixJ family response regulator
MTPSIRLLIVEPYRMLAEGLAGALGDEPDVRVVGCVGTAGEATRIVRMARPDVVLLADALPDGSGAQAARALHRLVPTAEVVLLTEEAIQACSRAAARAGAHSVVSKAAPFSRVLAAVRRASRSRRSTLAAAASA